MSPAVAAGRAGPGAVAALARAGRRGGHAHGRQDRAARIAGLAAWRAGTVLARAERDPGAVLAGRLAESDLRRRASLLLRTLRLTIPWETPPL